VRAGRKHTLPIVAMSSGRLFLSGLLASIARLRFTGIISLKRLPSATELFIIERLPVSKLFVSAQGTTAVLVEALAPGL
jgi:hypothetical protein